jgi:lambda family phage portal protein
VHGVSWFDAILLKLKDFDEYEDAALTKQKVAACLAAILTDPDGTAPALGRAQDALESERLERDWLSPGLVLNAPTGRDVTVVDPPAISEHEAFSKTILRGIAVGLGVPYEALTGDYSQSNFSSNRMARIAYWTQVEDWRWEMMVPQFYDPVWRWAMKLASVGDELIDPTIPAKWTGTPLPMIDPAQEGLALQRLLRIGALTWPEMIRQLGWDPDEVLTEIQTWNQKLDAAGVVLDGDPRKSTQGGQLQGPAEGDGSSGVKAARAAELLDLALTLAGRNGHR